MEAVLIAIVAGIFGGSGLVAIINAIKDYRNSVSDKESDADIRLYQRLEARLAHVEQQLKDIERELDQERTYNAQLIGTLSMNSINIPERITRDS